MPSSISAKGSRSFNASVISALPAYGRDYTSKKAVLADFLLAKDFTLIHYLRGRTYFSIRDIPLLLEEGVVSIQFRYSKQAKTFLLTLSKLQALYTAYLNLNKKGKES